MLFSKSFLVDINPVGSKVEQLSADPDATLPWF